MHLTRVRRLLMACGFSAVVALLSAATVLADGTGIPFPK
jgi:hypothetical protein